MRRTRPSSKASTLFEDKKKELIEQQNLLQQQMANLNQLIEEAPKRAKEEEEKRRKEIVRSNHRSPRLRKTTAVLHDPRHFHTLNASTTSTRPRKKELQAEKRDSRLKFFALFTLFVLVMLCLNHFR